MLQILFVVLETLSNIADAMHPGLLLNKELNISARNFTPAILTCALGRFRALPEIYTLPGEMEAKSDVRARMRSLVKESYRTKVEEKIRRKNTYLARSYTTSSPTLLAARKLTRLDGIWR